MNNTINFVENLSLNECFEIIKCYEKYLNSNFVEEDFLFEMTKKHNKFFLMSEYLNIALLSYRRIATNYMEML